MQYCQWEPRGNSSFYWATSSSRFSSSVISASQAQFATSIGFDDKRVKSSPREKNECPRKETVNEKTISVHRHSSAGVFWRTGHGKCSARFFQWLFYVADENGELLQEMRYGEDRGSERE